MVKNEKLLKLLNDGKIEELKKALENNIIEECNKSAGAKSKDLSIIKRIVNSKEAKYNQAFSKAHKFNYNGMEYFGFLEGHYIMASNSDFNYQHAEAPFKLAPMIATIDEVNTSATINRADVVAFKKTRTDKKAPFKIFLDDYVIGLNPDFLLDGMDWTNTDTIHFIKNTDKKRKCQKGPICLYNGDKSRIAYILPITTEYKREV